MTALSKSRGRRPKHFPDGENPAAVDQAIRAHGPLTHTHTHTQGEQT
jgi:hypothetical protein